MCTCGTQLSTQTWGAPLWMLLSFVSTYDYINYLKRIKFMHHHDNYSKILGNDELKIVGSTFKYVGSSNGFHSFDRIWTLEGQGLWYTIFLLLD
jgi:hypothetical protein